MTQTKLPLLPLDPAWLEESSAFNSQDASLVRASMLLVIAASRSSHPGALADDEVVLARSAGLSVGEWRASKEVLLSGLEVREIEGVQRWVYPAMLAVYEKINERFGTQIEELLASSALAVQACDQFALTGAVAPAPSRARGKRALPKDFDWTPELRAKAAEAGYAEPAHQQWVMERFKDAATSKDWRYKDWDATLRNFLSSSITVREFQGHFGATPRELMARAVSTGRGNSSFTRSAPGGAQTFERMARAGGESAVDQAMAARGYASDAATVHEPRRGFGFGGGFSTGARQ